MNTIPILMYHNIGRPPSGARLRGLYVPAKAFARQMHLLRILGYRGVSMSDALPHLEGEIRGRVAVITFDDGYTDTLEFALPVLKSLGWTSTCYVVSNRMGQLNDWDMTSLNVCKPLMNTHQVLQWHAAGMEVGAHTRTHASLTHCTDAELEDEVVGCKADLESLLDTPVTQFSYPYGVFDSRVVAAVQKAGFHTATTTRRGRARPHDDLLRLPRVLVSGSNLTHMLAVKLVTPYEDRRS